MTALKIAGWDETFECADSRKRDKLFWYQNPCGTESTGLIMLRRHGSQGLAAFGVFSMLCQLHAATEGRDHRRAGVLCRNDGRPMSVEFIADKLRIAESDLQDAIELLSSADVCWLEKLASADNLPRDANEMPPSADNLPRDDRHNTNSTNHTIPDQQNQTKKTNPQPPPVFSSSDSRNGDSGFVPDVSETPPCTPGTFGARFDHCAKILSEIHPKWTPAGIGNRYRQQAHEDESAFLTVTDDELADIVRFYQRPPKGETLCKSLGAILASLPTQRDRAATWAQHQPSVNGSAVNDEDPPF